MMVMAMSSVAKTQRSFDQQRPPWKALNATETGSGESLSGEAHVGRPKDRADSVPTLASHASGMCIPRYSPTGRERIVTWRLPRPASTT